MTGPEHYETAEDLLKGADQWDETDPGQRYYVTVAYAAAQVHATLALTAATALGLDATPREFAAWDAVCGVKAT